MKRSLCITAAALVAGLAWSTPAQAQVDQVFGVNVGYFALRGEDAREDDVLAGNLSFLNFELKDFNGATFGGDYLIGLGNYVEVGGGIGFYQRTVPSTYLDLVDNDGSEIEQDLKLRLVPITVTARLFPIGRQAGVQPYVGAGIGFYNWRYSETGEFVDFSDGTIFRGSFVDDGTEVGPVAVAGVRFAVSPQMLVGGEFRYQAVRADLDPDLGFFADRIDLGGYTTQFTLQFRF